MDKFLSKLPKNVADSINKQGFALVSREEAAQTVSSFVAVREWDTHTSGLIKAYSMEGLTEPLLVEEQDIDKKLPVLRVLKNESEWKAFIEDRKVDYSLMWGSCCGKVDYCEKWKPMKPLEQYQ